MRLSFVGTVPPTTTLSGFEFANLQGGGRFRTGVPGLAFGPFLACTLGVYRNYAVGAYNNVANTGGTFPLTERALHEWLTVGIDGTFDVRL